MIAAQHPAAVRDSKACAVYRMLAWCIPQCETPTQLADWAKENADAFAKLGELSPHRVDALRKIYAAHRDALAPAAGQKG